MGKNSDILIDIYKKAKAKRLVLNQEEFATALGYSRVHLFDKMMKHRNDIPNELIEKANKFLNNTKNVSRETEEDKLSPTALRLLKLLEIQTDTVNSQQHIIKRYIEEAPDIGKAKNV